MNIEKSSLDVRHGQPEAGTDVTVLAPGPCQGTDGHAEQAVHLKAVGLLVAEGLLAADNPPYWLKGYWLPITPLIG